MTGSTPAAQCQCRRFGRPCTAAMTQEDLLCGTCRGDGCNSAFGVEGDASWFHLRLPPEITFVPGSLSMAAPQSGLPGSGPQWAGVRVRRQWLP